MSNASQLERIGLGTVQFGSHYGVTNRHGQPSEKECARIIETAVDAGIVYYDTAAYYGDSDLILAKSLPVKGMKVVTKVKTPNEVYQSADLFGEQLYGILSENVYATEIRNGISVYWPEKIDPDAQIVQMPLNIADRRNVTLLHKYRERGVEVHARSVFLQGLLLEKGATIRQCIKFVLDLPVNVAIVGVNSSDELKEIIEAVETIDQEEGGPIPHIGELDPRRWHANH